MYSQSRIKALGAAALLAGSLHLVGCGGGSSDSDDNSQPPPPTSNNKPTVSISSDAEVTEGSDLTVTATAADSDGSIASYAWKYISGPQVTLQGASEKQVSFTAPEIETDQQLVLEVTVTDDKGATATAEVTINIKRKVLSVTITGIVTDEPIASPNVVVRVGDEEFQITADENGKYSIEIEVDDSYADKLVRLVALGNSAINPEVEFISQLKSVSTLLAQAGDDGSLTKDENFGVNITNVSTAEFALIKRDNGDVEDEQALNNALLAVDADEKLLLAALIKIIVDNDNYQLPEGVESTLALISNAEDIDNFTNTVQGQDPDLIEATKEEIKEDDELVDETVSGVTGDYILMMPQYYRASVGQLTFNDDGSGYVSFADVDAGFTWQQQGPSVDISLTDPAVVNCGFYTDESNEQQEQCNYLVDLSMTILLENDANRTVELYSKYEDRWMASQEVVNTSESTSNFSLIDKQQTIAVTAEELVGTWVVDGGSDFYGFSNAVSFDLAAGGTGTLRDNDKDPVSVTWELAGNRLLITSTAETVNFDYEIWLIKNVQVGYQFAASLNSKSDSATRTSTGLMVKDNELTFSKADLLGKWTVYQGYNSPQTDLHYDVYDDGLMNFNLNQNYRSWQVSNDGVFLRYNYFTDNGVQPICPQGQTCQPYSEFSQRLLATNDGQNFTYRKYRFFNPDGSERFEDYSSHLRNFSVADTYGVTRFAPYWLEENSGFDQNGFPTSASFIELYNPKEKGVEAIKIATNYNEDTQQNEYLITFSYLGVATSYEYSLAAGKLLFNGMQTEVTDFDRDFLTVCTYSQGGVCNEANQQTWYFNEAKASEQIELVRPEPAHPLDGAWQLADEPDVVVVLRDGKWIQVQSLSKDDEDDGFPGYEFGDFTWNAETGEFTVDLAEDTNGVFGLSDTGGITANVNGDVMTLNIEGEGEIMFTRIYDPSNPLIGAYIEGSISSGDFFMAVFKEDGYFIELEHTQEYDSGITGSTYTVASDPSGDPSTLSVTVDYFTNQLDDLSEIDPYFVVQPLGNKIIWHDGDEFGVMQRVTDVDANEIEFTEADVIGEHVLRYITDDGTGTIDLVLSVNSDNSASFFINGEQRTVEWSLELGQLKLYSPLELEGDSAYGVMISPQAVINEDEGFAVSVFGFEAPDNHPDMEDPELFINVAGSMLKQ